MVEALRKKGLPYAYLLFEGEQHGFRKAETIVARWRRSCRSTRRSWGSSATTSPCSRSRTSEGVAGSRPVAGLPAPERGRILRRRCQARNREVNAVCRQDERRRNLSAAQPPIIDIDRSGCTKSGMVDPVPRPLRPQPSPDQELELLVGGAVPHRRAEVGLVQREQAVAEHALGRHPEPVAGVAERLGHGGDHADPSRCAVGEPVRGGRLVRVALGHERMDRVDRREDRAPPARPSRAPTRAARPAACIR